jgi:glutamate-ammonia-ligase adenylyltransferase
MTHEIQARLERLPLHPEGQPALQHLTPHLLSALSVSASPDRALINFERFLAATPDSAGVLEALSEDPRTVDALVAVFAGSQYLTEILLRNPPWVSLLSMHSGIARIKTAACLATETRQVVAPWRTGAGESHREALDALRRFQQRELLRIGAADLAGLVELASVTSQLSLLADAIIQATLEIVAVSANVAAAGFAVLAMGKLGGNELNYSSDVDLLFLARDDGEQHADDCRRLGERLITALTEATAAGSLYRVDMRLRPWGRVGPLVPTVEGYWKYLLGHARLWEKQALLRARPVAGDLQLGARFLARAEPLLYGAGEEAIRREVYGMKQLTEAHLRQAGRTWGEVKLGEGSIRDAEFVVQYLQLAHGAEHPQLRTGNTKVALEQLTELSLLPPDEHRVLSEGYTFLRTVEHYLQILEYRQTHTLPTAPFELRYLAQRLGFDGSEAADEFVARYEQHAGAVRAIYLRHLSGQGQPGQRSMRGRRPSSHLRYGGATMLPGNPGAPSPEARQHMSRLAPSYGATFDPVEIERHSVMAAQLTLEEPVAVDAQPLDEGRTRVTVVGFDYLGELSLICGLLFASGFSILDGYVYTYEPGGRAGQGQRKIVDVFTVKPVGRAPCDGPASFGPPSHGPTSSDVWSTYKDVLVRLVRYLQDRQLRAAQGELAKRVAAALGHRPEAEPALPPVDIEIDNDASDRYTVLQISATDTPGFLYEFTNALALSGVHISQVFVLSIGNRVRDTLFVTDARGGKIVDEEKQRELRAATVLIKHFTHLLPRSPNPESALIHFHEYLGELFARPSWPDELASLERPEVLDALARLLGVSEFLWDDFLRMQYENLFPIVRDVHELSEPKARFELAAELQGQIRAGPAEEWRASLNRFKDREMFRIDMRHIMGQTDSFAAFSGELADLAEVVLDCAVQRVWDDLVRDHGLPLDVGGNPARFALAALGKCGGREMGFASDIELMFLYDGSGDTAGPKCIPGPEFFERLVIETTRSITARRAGVFEIDLQLRPHGKAGSLAVSLDSFRRYFAPSGAAWPFERQALVKLRPIAGDADLGRDLVALRDEFVYTGEPFDVAAMRAMRERQLRHLVEAGQVNAKYSKGGLVDLEYVVQGLQIAHGRRHPAVRVTNTALAIDALASVGAISLENAARLREALLFLEQLINALRVVRGNSKDLAVPPVDTEEFAFLARRFGYGDDPERLEVAMNEFMGTVQMLEARLLG